MLPKSKGGRTLAAGGALLLATALLSFTLRGLTPAYSPSAPEYRVKGPADAPVVIAEFSSFRCPGCAAAQRPLQNVLNMFPGKIRLVFKNVAWETQKWAEQAAAGAECAGRAGDFWAFHDKLFDNMMDWAVSKNEEELKAKLLGYAKEAGAHEADFKDCIEGPAALAMVRAEREEAIDNWVRATPTFFINGKRFVGGLQLRTHGLNHIEDILQR